MDTTWILGGFFVLILGGYGWTTAVGAWLYRHFTAALNKFEHNHMAHFEERLSSARGLAGNDGNTRD